MEKFQLLRLIEIDTFLDIHPSGLQGLTQHHALGLMEFLIHRHGISHTASKKDTQGIVKMGEWIYDYRIHCKPTMSLRISQPHGKFKMTS